MNLDRKNLTFLPSRRKLKMMLAFSFIFYVALSSILQVVSAQSQEFTFGGNTAESYQCFTKNGCLILKGNIDTCNPVRNIGSVGESEREVPVFDAAAGEYYCEYKGERIRATLRPPALQIIEVWFTRILYIIWALVGSFSFLLLVALGYQYMIKRDTSDQALVDLRRRILYYIIGFALVFLAVPILTSIFNLLGINKNYSCYDVNMPGFQFFFATLCTDPRGAVAGQVLTDPCSLDPSEVAGRLCPESLYNRSRACLSTGSADRVTFVCRGDATFPAWEVINN